MKLNLKAIRKFFNWPSPEEAKLIDDGCAKMLKLAKEKSYEFYNDQDINQKSLDGKCPKCENKNIVNKITRVEGKGHISGSFMYGSGSLYGSTHIDTNDVNHCNNCGNQWKKYEKRYKWEDDFIASWLDDINTHYEGEYTFGDKTLKLLQDIPAESIWKEGCRVSRKCYSKTMENLTLKYLRTKFKSIYQ